MQFRIKKKKKKEYKAGDQRVLRKFAFLPVRITDDCVIWLERYWEQQILRIDDCYQFWHGINRLYWYVNGRSIAKDPWSHLR